MQLAAVARDSLIEIRHGLMEVAYRVADPVDSGPVAPGGDVQSQANGLFGNMKWVAAVIAVFCIVGGGIMMGVSHQSGRPNDGLGRIGMTIFGLGCGAAAASVVGTMTGT